MKTTIEVANPLLEDARQLAISRGTTLRALVEQGLRQVLDNAAKSGDFHLRAAGFCGHGLQASLKDADWSQLRELAYAQLIK